jgi:hypothetical protein
MGLIERMVKDAGAITDVIQATAPSSYHAAACAISSHLIGLAF